MFPLGRGPQMSQNERGLQPLRESNIGDRPHNEAMAELLKEDPAYAIDQQNSILDDGEQVELLIALRQMTKAIGGVQDLAKKATLN